MVFGGVASGLFGMQVFALLAVFVAGLMIGRTPACLGKEIEHNPAMPKHLLTETGIGYRFVP